MRIGADERIGERHTLAHQHPLRQVFEVHLVHDARRGRHHTEVLERLSGPRQKFVALLVSLEFQIGVALQGECRPEKVHLDTVVDHEVHGHERVDLLRVAAHFSHRVAHGRQVHHSRHARVVLHDDARR